MKTPRIVLIAASVLLMALFVSQAAQKKGPTVVKVVPLGSIDKAMVQSVARGVAKSCGAKTVVVPNALPLPKSAYDQSRRQYSAIQLLQYVKSKTSHKGQKVLAITDRDIFLPDLAFCFSKADQPGAAAVMSITRLDNSNYGLPANRALTVERSVKVGAHAVAHTLGLQDCPDPNCLMAYSISVPALDAKSSAFCKVCKRRLSQVSAHP